MPGPMLAPFASLQTDPVRSTMVSASFESPHGHPERQPRDCRWGLRPPPHRRMHSCTSNFPRGSVMHAIRCVAASNPLAPTRIATTSNPPWKQPLVQICGDDRSHHDAARLLACRRLRVLAHDQRSACRLAHRKRTRCALPRSRYLDRAGGIMGLGRVFLLSVQATWEGAARQ